jgi:hypothetical protein
MQRERIGDTSISPIFPDVVLTQDDEETESAFFIDKT